ncbi:hypothetical protein EBL_c00480 [Shimwellia blattae DSM 4481 = NBRC 105725]|uniref:Uncharacterized protein n=1 Tax=Shimwellia blattae (strain ATCC 29907 / DSM 4481 / JCM 1650 / NBRC 105725 / CDC 9005-74) TaxID=630626 RepID=I2B3T1_SHIBC|nr:hypothetical protein EBL_c00480 [Shimwellia blattae DSM 4481 = NBRC 105725]
MQQGRVIMALLLIYFTGNGGLFAIYSLLVDNYSSFCISFLRFSLIFLILSSYILIIHAHLVISGYYSGKTWT